MIHDLVDGDQIDNQEERKLLKLTEQAAQDLTMMEAQNTALVTVNDELHEQLARITAEIETLKIFCAKAYFDIHGGVRKEIYDMLGDELSELMSKAAALKQSS